MEMEGKGEGKKRKDRSLKHHSTLITLPFLLPLTPKRSFFLSERGFSQREMREIRLGAQWRLFASHHERLGDRKQGTPRASDEKPSNLTSSGVHSAGPPTLMGPRDVFTRDGTTCTDAYPDLGCRLALFNAAPSFPRPRPFYLMRGGNI